MIKSDAVINATNKGGSAGQPANLELGCVAPWRYVAGNYWRSTTRAALCPAENLVGRASGTRCSAP
jgi:hypothetical protein